MKEADQGSQKPEIKLPPNFRQSLVEVISPSQSTDVYELGDLLFPITVLCIGPEKKLLRLGRACESNYDRMLSLSVGELCRLYEPSLNLNWAAKNASKEQLEEFYLKHLEKLAFNDDVISVVNQVIECIDWKPLDEKRKAEIRAYLPAHIFSPVTFYLNVIENSSINEIFTTMTRGLLEIVKLSNMIANDRMKFHDSEYRAKAPDKMATADTFEKFTTGLNEQGFNLKDIF